MRSPNVIYFELGQRMPRPMDGEYESTLVKETRTIFFEMVKNNKKINQKIEIKKNKNKNKKNKKIFENIEKRI